MDQTIVIVPGIGNSGPDHWQSHWEAALPGAVRMSPASWDAPDLRDWMAALDEAVAQAATPPVVICHSLGCLLFAHWRAASTRVVRGAWLVAVPDSGGPRFPVAARAFADVPAGDFASFRCWRSPARMTGTTRPGAALHGRKRAARRRCCSARAAI